MDNTPLNDINVVKGKWEDIRNKLPDIILYYEADLAMAITRISVKGKTGAEAVKDQTAWPVQYGMKKAEIEKLLKYMWAQVEACRGRLYRKYNENYSKVLGERTIEKYIDNEDEYLQYYQIYLEIEELLKKYTAVCDAWDKRGFALRDWTQLKVVEMQEAVI
jgi:hypothetical protein